MKVFDRLRKSMKLDQKHEHPWASMQICVDLWKSMRINENQLEVYEPLWKSKNIYSMGFQSKGETAAFGRRPSFSLIFHSINFRRL